MAIIKKTTVQKTVEVSEKAWWASKTIQTAAATLAITILSAYYGETSTITTLAISVASVFNIYGRITAVKTITR